MFRPEAGLQLCVSRELDVVLSHEVVQRLLYAVNWQSHSAPEELFPKPSCRDVSQVSQHRGC